MIRRRPIGIRTRAIGRLGSALVALLALALIFYGLMVILLAVKVDPGFVNAISGYRTAFDALSGIGADSVDGVDRAIVAGAGLLAFVLFGLIAYGALPRPYLTRNDLHLRDGGRGVDVVAVKAVERIAERAARGGGVADASARYERNRLQLDLEIVPTGELLELADAVRGRLTAAFDTVQVPEPQTEISITGVEQPERSVR